MPVDVRGHYSLLVDAERVSGQGPLILGLIVEGQQFAVVIDDENRLSGLQMLGGKGIASHDVKYSGPIFEGGKAASLVVSVGGFDNEEKLAIAVLSGKMTLFVWTGKRNSPSVAPEWATPNTDVLFIGSQDASYKITKVTYRKDSAFRWWSFLAFTVWCVVTFGIDQRMKRRGH